MCIETERCRVHLSHWIARLHRVEIIPRQRIGYLQSASGHDEFVRSDHCRLENATVVERNPLRPPATNVSKLLRFVAIAPSYSGSVSCGWLQLLNCSGHRCQCSDISSSPRDWIASKWVFHAPYPMGKRYQRGVGKTRADGLIVKRGNHIKRHHFRRYGEHGRPCSRALDT